MWEPLQRRLNVERTMLSDILSPLKRLSQKHRNPWQWVINEYLVGSAHPAKMKNQSASVSKLALPPAAVVFTVKVRSLANLSR